MFWADLHLVFHPGAHVCIRPTWKTRPVLRYENEYVCPVDCASSPNLDVSSSVVSIQMSPQVWITLVMLEIQLRRQRPRKEKAVVVSGAGARRFSACTIVAWRGVARGCGRTKRGAQSDDVRSQTMRSCWPVCSMSTTAFLPLHLLFFPASLTAQTGSCFMSEGTCDNVCGDGICAGTDTCEVRVKNSLSNSCS